MLNGYPPEYAPWGHHKYIIDKYFNKPEKAMFFVRKTLENGGSRVSF